MQVAVTNLLGDMVERSPIRVRTTAAARVFLEGVLTYLADEIVSAVQYDDLQQDEELHQALTAAYAAVREADLVALDRHQLLVHVQLAPPDQQRYNRLLVALAQRLIQFAAQDTLCGKVSARQVQRACQRAFATSLAAHAVSSGTMAVLQST
jgi:hypothetical protein